MTESRRRYQAITEWAHDDVEQALVDNDPESLQLAVVAVSMHDPDWRYAQNLCIRLSTHAHYIVRGNAVLGFGHIARVHGKLDRSLVQPIIERALCDSHEYVRGHGHDAKNDTTHYLGWEHEQLEADPPEGLQPKISPAQPEEAVEEPGIEMDPDVDEAERLANEGRLVEAEVLFAKAISNRNPSACIAYANFLERLGRLSQAEAMYERAGEFATPENRKWESKSLNGLGLIYQIRGDLDQAEAMLRKSLEIDEELGNREGMATAYGNLGLIYQARDDLDPAEEMHRKSLEIDEELGNREGMAAQYGNLGLIYGARGDLDRAEEMYRKSLEITEELGIRETSANQYGNLGNIYGTRGDLDRAEEMYRKSLEITEELGIRETSANQYGNLGLIYWNRGDLDRAEEMHRKSLEITEELGHRAGIADDHSNLGDIYRARGDFHKARAFYKKALEIYEQIGAKGENWELTLADLTELDEKN